MNRFLITFSAAALAGAAMAAPAAKPAKTAPKPAPAKAALNCPVTGEKIGSMGKAAGKSVYKGKTYYFCCAACKPEFDKNPAKYVKTAKAPAKTGHKT